MRSTTSTPDPDDEFSREPTASRLSRRRLATVTAAVAATGLAFTALLFVQAGAEPDQPAAAAPSSSASASAAPDPLTFSATPTSSGEKPDDNTGKAREDASRTLADWSGGNPASRGDHAVGGDNGSGAGGRITEVLRIPALGRDWVQPVYDGVGDRQLRAGVGHFPDTEQPGQIGNFALAGHRSGVADPAFRDVDRITPGAAIMVTTVNRITYAYTVTRVRTVAPTDVNVIAQVPGRPDATPTTAKLTLVTCWPATGHSKRVVVEADLVSARGGA